jgi:protease I
MRFVHEFFEQGKPVGDVCHGPWSLVETGDVEGRRVASWPSLKTDIRNADGMGVDEEIVIDRGLFTSRNPDDLPACCAKLVEEAAEGVHAEQREAVRS